MSESIRHLSVNVYIVDVSPLEDPILFNRYLETMPDYRKEKVLACKGIEERRLVLASGILLSRGIRECGLEERSLEICHNNDGKPYFAGYPNLDFSIARSGKRTICAVTMTEDPVGCKIGCDVEEKSKEQIDYLSSQNLTLEQWTRLESYAKASQTDIASLFYGEAKVIPGYMFTQPEVEDLYVYTICCQSRIPQENIHIVDLTKE